VGLPEEPPASTDSLGEKSERLLAVVYLLTARTASLEESNAEVRKKLSLDPPPPMIGAEWKTIKQVAGDLGFSQTTVRNWIASGRIASRRIGRAVLIDAVSLPPRRCETLL